MEQKEVTPDAQEARVEPAAGNPWHPAVFAALAFGSVIFWPAGVAGLFAVASRSPHKRHQGIIVIVAGTLGFLWGWKLLWSLMGWGG